MLIIVTSETPGSVSVSYVALMRAPRHVHRRKHIARMQELRGRDELIDVAPPRLRVRRRGGAVKRAQPLRDLSIGRLAIRYVADSASTT